MEKDLLNEMNLSCVSLLVVYYYYWSSTHARTDCTELQVFGNKADCQGLTWHNKKQEASYEFVLQRPVTYDLKYSPKAFTWPVLNLKVCKPFENRGRLRRLVVCWTHMLPRICSLLRFLRKFSAMLTPCRIHLERRKTKKQFNESYLSLRS